MSVRLAAFCALAAFGALHWTALVSPAAPARGLLMVALAAAIAPAARVLERWSGTRRAIVVVVFAVLLVAALLLAAGVPLRLLAPDAWGDLANGISQGISALPGLNVPYNGLDDWVRAVVLSGAGLLAVTAAALALRPGAGSQPGAQIATAAVLTALYAVPVIEHAPRAPFLGGAVFALLLTAFLWLERVASDDIGIALTLALFAIGMGLVVGPQVDGRRPLLDYQAIASHFEKKGATRFTWTHRYGPLDWPRDGREVLRVRAKHSTYWKAVNLNLFDGIRWRQAGTVNPIALDTEYAPNRPGWHEKITVFIRNMRSLQYVSAGTTSRILESPRAIVTSDPGTFVTGTRLLRPGDTYQARVYTPQPTATELRAAGTDYPDFVSDLREMILPFEVGGPPEGRGVDSTGLADIPSEVIFPPYGSRLEALAIRPDQVPARTGTQLVRASRYGRMYALAQQLARASSSPFDFVRRVQRRVELGATYTESPPRHAVPLDAFVFDDRQGYCQQFSGAMTLLLRMGGVPARVASGFTPGTYDRRRREWVVRDVDAHSWVEAYFPGYGWVPFDPTPVVAPPRAQADPARFVSAALGDQRDKGGAGDRGSDPHAAGSGPGSDRGWRLVGLTAALLALAALSLVRIGRRGRPPGPPPPPELAELYRALHRSGRGPQPRTTLTDLERLLDTAQGGAEYVRALRHRRFAGSDDGPTAAQRRALRRALGDGLGIGGTLRAWWALPPRIPRSRRL